MIIEAGFPSESSCDKGHAIANNLWAGTVWVNCYDQGRIFSLCPLVCLFIPLNLKKIDFRRMMNVIFDMGWA
ncbi:MAG: hypothetical protein V7K53_09615 [Nostoc sp.]|uniref:hypothetical protein n=1 Tax=Nostoc sp. TaxID=1180 RepID=UPI002FF4C2D9